MARRIQRTTTINTALQKGRQSSQRERLLAGMITAANRDGYARTNVSGVIAEAGISRRTYYEHFADKDDCFLAAVADVHGRVLRDVRRAVREQPPERALAATIGALVHFVSYEPAMGRFLINEPMAGGAAALDARDRGIAALARLVDRSYHELDPATGVPDFSTHALIGGIYRLLASRLRRGERDLTGVQGDLLAWTRAYEQPLGKHRWRPLKLAASPSRSPFVHSAPLRGPDPLPPGRTRLSEQEVAANQRQRIMFAAARLAEEKGYTATTIGDITKLARIDGRVFYAMFADKQDAFMAVHELGVQQVMAVTADAFFAGTTWPERNWEAGRAFTQFLERNPLIANVGFVEAYAVGPGAAQRVEDSHTAFAMLLQEGYQYVSADARPPRLVLEAIITTIFEIVYSRARSAAKPRLAGLLPHLTFLVLSPFLGPAQANAFIDQKLEAASAG